MKAWELLSKPGAWTQGYFARNSNEEMRNSRDEDACCWCAMGGISRCYSGPEWASAVNRLSDAVGGHIPKWNDTPGRTQEEVVALLKELDI